MHQVDKRCVLRLQLIFDVQHSLTILHHGARPVKRDAVLPRQLVSLPLPIRTRRLSRLLSEIVYQQGHPALLLEHIVLLRLHIRRHDDRLLFGQIGETHQR